jgi:hypothetical protein
MKPQNYHTRITAKVTAKEAVEKVNRVSAWWGKNVEGSPQKLNDIFTIRFGETWVTFQVVDVVTDKRIEWEVTDCFLPWLTDKTEWKNNYLIWELSAQKDSTQIDFTHVGLIPEIECYDACHQGWNFHINESLFKLLTENQGLPDQR